MFDVIVVQGSTEGEYVEFTSREDKRYFRHILLAQNKKQVCTVSMMQKCIVVSKDSFSYPLCTFLYREPRYLNLLDLPLLMLSLLPCQQPSVRAAL